MNTKFLKIGIICYPSIGGSGIVATQLGHELAKKGHEIHFISYSIPFHLDTSIPNVYYHPVVINEYSLFRYPDYTLPLSVKMAEISKNYDLDILHVHYAIPHATAAFLTQKMLGGEKPKIVTTLHGTDITLIAKDPNFQPIVKFSIENSCAVTTVSESLKQETLETLNIQKHIEVVYNFYQPDIPNRTRESVRKSLNIQTDEILGIHMSNLREVKRIPDLLALTKKVQDLPFKLLIIAGGSFAPFQEEVKKLGIEKHIIVRESVMDRENYLNASDIGIYTSEQESFGLGILESMAFGLPVIGTNVGGIPEVILHNQTGYISSVGDTNTLGEKLTLLIQNTSLRKDFGIAGKERAINHFSPEKIIPQYEMIYQKVLLGVCE